MHSVCMHMYLFMLGVWSWLVEVFKKSSICSGQSVHKNALFYKDMPEEKAMKVLIHLLPSPMLLIYHFMLIAFCFIPLKLCINHTFQLEMSCWDIIPIAKYRCIGTSFCLKWLTLQGKWGDKIIFTREETWCLSTIGIATFISACSLVS